MSRGGKCYVLVEGHGEVEAAGNLLARVAQRLDLPFVFPKPIRWKNLHQERGVQRGAELIRARADAAALLVLRDEDDACPKDVGPRISEWLAHLSLPFPAAAVLLYPEYEVLFLPGIDRIAGATIDGRPGILPGTKWDAASWEARRGVKEWLTKHMPPGRSYKPTVDQLALTRSIDLDELHAADVACFGTLVRALQFLAEPFGNGRVYPSPPK